MWTPPQLTPFLGPPLTTSAIEPGAENPSTPVLLGDPAALQVHGGGPSNASITAAFPTSPQGLAQHSMRLPEGVGWSGRLGSPSPILHLGSRGLLVPVAHARRVLHTTRLLGGTRRGLAAAPRTFRHGWHPPPTPGEEIQPEKGTSRKRRQSGKRVPCGALGRRRPRRCFWGWRAGLPASAAVTPGGTWGRPMHCGVFGTVPELYSPDANAPLSANSAEASGNCRVFPGGQTPPLC